VLVEARLVPPRCSSESQAVWCLVIEWGIVPRAAHCDAGETFVACLGLYNAFWDGPSKEGLGSSPASGVFSHC